MKRPFYQGEIVAEVTPEVMEGDDIQTRWLNAYLTRSYILSRDVPADECLSEARHLLTEYNCGNLTIGSISNYLRFRFARLADEEHQNQISKEIWFYLTKFPKQDPLRPVSVNK